MQKKIHCKLSSWRRYLAKELSEYHRTIESIQIYNIQNIRREKLYEKLAA